MLQLSMRRKLMLIVILCTLVIIEPALPSPFLDYLFSQSSQQRFTPIPYFIPISKEDSYDPDPYSDAPIDAEHFSMDFPSLENELEVIVCEGEDENYTCNPINNGGYYEVYEY